MTDDHGTLHNDGHRYHVNLSRLSRNIVNDFDPSPSSVSCSDSDGSSSIRYWQTSPSGLMKEQIEGVNR